MGYIFEGCTSIYPVDLSSWNTSNVTNMSGMFKDSNLDDIEQWGISNWDVSKCDNFDKMFNNCKNLRTLDLSNWVIKSPLYMDNLVSNCTNLESIKFKPDIAQVKSVTSMFASTPNLKTIENCPIHIWETDLLRSNYWAYGNDNDIYNGLNVTFSSVGKFKNWLTAPYIPFFNKVSLETITNLGNAMYDYASEGTNKTLSTRGYLSRFTEEQIAIFTNKGWTLT